MTRVLIAIFTLFYVFTAVTAQSKDDLQKAVNRIVADKKATVGVVVSNSKGKEIAAVNADKRLPMQSVFKFHIALKMLSEIDKGKFTLDQKIEIKKSELLPGLYSPIRDEYPEGVTLTIAKILQYTVSQSDNVGCDVLMRILGGPEPIENYFEQNGFKNISIKINEETQQGHWERQYQNWITARESNKILRAFFDNKKKYLSKSSHEFLWKTMRETSTGLKRLKNQLPENTVVAHKTGTSGTNKSLGITAATNDIGVVFLPNGKHFFVSVYVGDSKEDAETNEKIIADIAKAAWDSFSSR